MRLEFIDQAKLFIDKTNMRYGKRAPDVSDIIATVRKRGVIQPLIVKPANELGLSGIVAGARRWTAHCLAAAEGFDHGPLACAILEDGDDADAIEASLIENIARLDPDEVNQWETFTRLVKEGRDPGDIAQTFGLPDLAVKRILALGNLMPRVRSLFQAGKIDRATVRHLTLASKSQQRAWLALLDDEKAYCPTGHNLKAWLFGGQSIPVKHALFGCEGVPGIVTDLFGEEAYFSDADAFWVLQHTEIEAKRVAFLEAGWPDVVIVPAGEHFQIWEYEKAAKRKGGRVYIDVRGNGEVIVHEGYVTRKEARRIEKGETIEPDAKATRPEVTSTLGTYIDLHRHAAARAEMINHPGLALRLMVAHAVVGSPLWTVRPEPQSAKTDAVRESIELAAGETLFDHARLKVLRLLGRSKDEPMVAGGNSDPRELARTFLRLVALCDEDVMAVIAVVMGETLMAGSAAVDAVGSEMALDMTRYWLADDAFFDLLRDREVLAGMVGEVAGTLVAEANVKEKGKTLKAIVRAHLHGEGGRAKVEGWVPRWMAFPPRPYTNRGGVGSVAAHALVEAARGLEGDPAPETPGAALAPAEPEDEGEAVPIAA
ncbi:ParB/RepB/Spo0J family partition protein [Novosphingobium sp. G106]|uniref:ParB/RepB/Spo0J family partition protein n=1 Tax=Novosphingobium sp. G106 TaxID=2849500 RepID=UPI001C2CE47C|nr:ParB N-terminal domain-containing protein [Novosphingobium sp. G106]MBV1687702.1 ParB/RepB/Spo0J family partition protein [Novosphingobium sp. G106]